MKKFLSRYFPLIPVVAIIALSVFSPSCANTTQAPTGGPRDSIPPVMRKVSPVPGTTKVPVHGTQIVFTFDEYVTVKDNKGIYLSPPLSKSPRYKIKGKSLVVYFEEDLLPNTTYTLDLTNAIADNNESNMFPGFTTWFSTGETIDSLYMTGRVFNCNDLKPIKGATVMLYKDHRDSAVFLTRPAASAKTDDWGYFSVRNIQDTLYRVYAIVDGNGNNIYDPDEDRIAFLDTLFQPKYVVRDSVPELMKYDMKDTLACLARRSDVELNVFRERPSKQMLMNKVRLSDRASYITFMAPDTQIDSLWFRGYAPERVITEFNPRKDSLLLWLNVQRPMPDTLFLNVRYWKTDSLGVLKPETEEVSLVEENKPKSRAARKKVQHADTVCALTLKATPETFEQYGYSIVFDDPPILAFFDSLKFTSVNPRQKEEVEKFKIERDSTNLRKYDITPLCKIQPGWDYIFNIPERTFKDINGYWNDSTKVKISLPKDEDLSSLTLNVKGVRNKYIVDFQKESKSEIIRTYIIESDCQLLFPYLQQGKYAIRITEDVNRNGIVDTGNLLKHIQPEKVRYLKIDDEDFIVIPERSEVVQDLDLETMFK
ncbi:MAG: Ig-like domain-containing protein [Bacteroidales bacterium]|nr:Ig-like domain-containing protein [Bacteroidales bacterium]